MTTFGNPVPGTGARRRPYVARPHRDSPERPLLEEMGILASGELGCSANTLANESAKWAHARSRHNARLQQYNDEIARRERKEFEEKQARRDDAMFELVKQRTQEPARQSKPFSQLNRGELMQIAREKGLIPEDEDYADDVTNAQIREAIKAKESE